MSEWKLWTSHVDWLSTSRSHSEAPTYKMTSEPFSNPHHDKSYESFSVKEISVVQPSGILSHNLTDPCCSLGILRVLVTLSRKALIVIVGNTRRGVGSDKSWSSEVRLRGDVAVLEAIGSLSDAGGCGHLRMFTSTEIRHHRRDYRSDIFIVQG